MEGDNVISSDRRRRRRAVDGEQLLALGARRAKARRPKEDGVGRAAVVIIGRGGVAPPPPVAELSALELHEGLTDVVEALRRSRRGERDGRNDRLHARNCSPAFARRSCEHGSVMLP